MLVTFDCGLCDIRSYKEQPMFSKVYMLDMCIHWHVIISRKVCLGAALDMLLSGHIPSSISKWPMTIVLIF